MSVTVSPGRRETWDETTARVARQYPSVGLDQPGWFEALGGAGDDFTDVFADIWRDLLKLDGPDRGGRSGPRPQVDYRRGAALLRQYAGRDFAAEPFPQALSTLLQWKPNGNGRQAGRISLTSLARKSGLSRSVCYRLLVGEQTPSADEMEAVAGALGKHPSYFIEWRIGYLAALVIRRLEQTPEYAADLYRGLTTPRVSQ